jgi:hypothetical protein
VDLYISTKDILGKSLFVEDVNSWVRGTHEFHENWTVSGRVSEAYHFERNEKKIRAQ